MTVSIAKDFWWEMSHRLPFHKGPCRNIHGHTYKLTLELEGTPDENGIVMDYYDMKEIVAPVLARLDHAFLCDSDDYLMINFLKENNFKYVVMDKTTTSENIARHLFDTLRADFSKYKNLTTMKVKIFETSDVYAETGGELQ